MEDEELGSRPHRAYKFTQSIFYIFVVPMLVLALISGLIMLNTKSSGGYPNFLGYTVMQFANNDFYNPVTKEYAINEQQMFVSLAENDYKVGDLIGYYSAVSESPPIQGRPSWPTSSYSLNFDNTYAETFSTDELSETSFGIIGNIGLIYDTNGNSYKCFSLFSSLDDQENGSDQDTIVLAIDTIGVAIDSIPFFIDFLVYCSTISSFITLVLVPCIILLVLQIIATLFKLNIEREKRSGIKQKIRLEEIKIQEEYALGQKTMHPLDDRATLARSVEAFDFKRIKPKKIKMPKNKAVNGNDVEYQGRISKIPKRPFSVYQQIKVPTRPLRPTEFENAEKVRVIPERPIPTKPARKIPTKPVKPERKIPVKPVKPIPQRPVKPIPKRPQMPDNE